MKKKHVLLLLPILASFAMLIVFQNCSSDFDGSTYDGSASGASTTPPVDPDQSNPPTETPTLSVVVSTPSVELNTSSPATLTLSVIASSSDPAVTYQWFKDGQGLIDVGTKIVGAKTATLKITSEAVGLVGRHADFIGMQGSYKVRVKLGAEQALSEAIPVTYTQSVVTVEQTASCTGPKTVGGVTYTFNGSLKRTTTIASGAVAYSAPVMSVTANGHTCNLVSAGKARLITLTTPTIAKCYSDGTGFGVKGHLALAPGGIRVSVGTGSSSYLTDAQATASTIFCTGTWK